jgi:hypothetical protein
VFNNIEKTRDNIFINLELDVFSKLDELCKEDPVKPEVKLNSTRFVSFEEAIKELIEFKKNH